MKKIILISFLFFFISSISYSQSKFPQCKGTDFSKFNNCYAKINLGDKNAVYDGEFKNGKFHGQGTLINSEIIKNKFGRKIHFTQCHRILNREYNQKLLEIS